MKDPGGNSGGYIQLWYSNTCGTNWTRVVTQVGGTTFMSATLTPQGGSPHSLVCFVPGCTAIGGGNFQMLSGQYYLPTTFARSSGSFNTASDVYNGIVSQY